MMLAFTVAGWWWILCVVGPALVIGFVLLVIGDRSGGDYDLAGGCVPAMILILLSLFLVVLLVALRVTVTIDGTIGGGG